MAIKYKNPMHVPGWLIEENGVEILKETANRGSAGRPDPITYTYDFPKAQAASSNKASADVNPFADSAALKTAVDNCLPRCPPASTAASPSPRAAAALTAAPAATRRSATGMSPGHQHEQAVLRLRKR